ncbi:hypothetical protein NE237_003218 [Protea cynaroides]|uniref:Uncharacterized protein n=2 Tax=Magnoliopsida TaxID=3398 RepID=A0A9Q0KH08_9MAGN|nr:hypothetical protein NE237_003218 [Protea cynaroides]
MRLGFGIEQYLISLLLNVLLLNFNDALGRQRRSKSLLIQNEENSKRSSETSLSCTSGASFPNILSLPNLESVGFFNLVLRHSPETPAPATDCDHDSVTPPCHRSMLHAISAPNTCVWYQKSPNFGKRHFVTTKFRISSSLPDTDGVKVEYTPWLIVGLGNPGNKYHGTRHNVGFEMIDRISLEEDILLNTIQSKALIGIGSIGEVPVLLAKPQTYMNFSGESVGSLAAYYQVPLRHILLVYDEISLPNGVMRLQAKGGHGHHNGLKSVMDHLDGRREFPRLSIGIGNPPGKMDMRAYLLQKFSSEEQKQVDAALQQGVEAVQTLVLNGFNDGISRFNLRQKPIGSRSRISELAALPSRILELTALAPSAVASTSHNVARNGRVLIHGRS